MVATVSATRNASVVLSARVIRSATARNPWSASASPTANTAVQSASASFEQAETCSRYNQDQSVIGQLSVL